jgi:hypothetical protein
MKDFPEMKTQVAPWRHSSWKKVFLEKGNAVVFLKKAAPP